MKYSILLAALLTNLAFAGDVYVNGYTRNDGTYVQPHHRSTPDSNPYNNYGTQGNVNPYTGQAGTVNPYQQQSIYQAPTYQPYGQQHNNRGQSGIYGQ